MTWTDTPYPVRRITVAAENGDVLLMLEIEGRYLTTDEMNKLYNAASIREGT